jgi:hypothetical protein
MKRDLIQGIRVVAFATLCFAAGCRSGVDGQPVDMLARRDKLAPLIVTTWANKSKDGWSQVTVPGNVRSSREAKEAFLHAIKVKHIFEFSDLREEKLVLAEPIKIGAVWYGYVDGYGLPLSLVVEEGGSVVYHIDAWF